MVKSQGVQTFSAILVTVVLNYKEFIVKLRIGFTPENANYETFVIRAFSLLIFDSNW